MASHGMILCGFYVGRMNPLMLYLQTLLWHGAAIWNSAGHFDTMRRMCLGITSGTERC